MRKAHRGDTTPTGTTSVSEIGLTEEDGIFNELNMDSFVFSTDELITSDVDKERLYSR